ncbi:MAG TPA: hypothetical protein VFB16_02275 [Bauldia sp.]|nr:hypothetical protein [Bauldia sp.]
MLRIALSTGLCLSAAASALAQDKPSFKELIGSGYEIKDVSFVPTDALKPMGYPPDTGAAVLVTLQKGASSAVCGFNASNWSNQAAASLEGTSQCDVYNK